MNKIPIIFFGTHKFAATILEGLINSPLVDVKLVITQPDKPVGREQEVQKSPVKILAEKHGIKVEQPKTLKTYKLQPITYKLAIVAQYGLLIPKHTLEAPEMGTINVHTSLLPKYRGASPIQCALMSGETQTGVTIMKMDEGFDTGPILLQKTVKIDQNDTYLTLDAKLASEGLQALMEALPAYLEGKLTPKPQNTSEATECHQLNRDDGKIDWNSEAQHIYNLYRGLTPWPGIWTSWNGKRLKLLEILPSDIKIESGKVVFTDGKMYIGATNGSIEVIQLQLEGKKPMDVKTFYNGYKTIVDSKLS